MTPFQIETGAKVPQTTPRKFALLTSLPLGLFGSRWEQLPGYFLGEVWVLDRFHRLKPVVLTDVLANNATPYCNIHFAGEHCSVEFQGYMEGSAAEGIRAPNEVRRDPRA